MSDTPPIPSLPTEEQWLHRLSSWRRPFFRVTLAVGLVLFAIFVPPRIWQVLWVALTGQLWLVALIILFALVALSLVWSVGQRLDAWIFKAFNLHGFHPRWLDLVMFAATQLGSMVTALVLACLLFFLNYRREGIEVILGIFTLWLIVELIKEVTGRARPFLALEGARVIGWKEPGRSFPSGHTSQSFFLVALLITQFHPTPAIVIPMYLLAALVGFTRIYVGAHYPRDVIGGALLGTIWAAIFALTDPYLAGLNF